MEKHLPCNASWNESGNMCNHTHWCMVDHDPLADGIVHKCFCGREWGDN